MPGSIHTALTVSDHHRSAAFSGDVLHIQVGSSHLFLTPEQLIHEFIKAIGMVQNVFTTLDLGEVGDPAITRDSWSGQ